ncbi:MAG TPA: M20/M25/M40 family metallo-hydrolase [Candidatus Krumholzibacteria bacterium]|nr:M20/M25/M40 family metallo-hydrolase [Candidatus Krumholzibacteria bacterium]
MHACARLLPVACVLLTTATARASEHPSLAETYRDQASQIVGAALTSDHAYSRLSELCDGIGHRLSGSKQLELAVEWAAASMRADGLDVRLQPVRVPHWVRGRESAEMVEPRLMPLSMLGLGGSVGTPKRGITAPVVAVSSWDMLDSLPDSALRGKIVLYDVPFTTYGETVKFRGNGASRAATRGAVAVLVRSVGPTSLRTPHTGSLRYEEDKVAGDNAAGGNLAADNVAANRIPAAAVTIEDATMLHRLLDQGHTVRVRLQMEAKKHPDVLSHNVIGELRGRERPEEVVLLGGHLDSWDVGQGAHDDGGGCILAMEAVRIIHQLGLRPRRTLRVVLWTNEENGLRGANAYRDSLGSAVRNHVAAIEADMGVERLAGFGVRVEHDTSDVASRERHVNAVARAREIGTLLAGLGGDRITEDGGGADIGPLMKLGVPGLAHRTIGERYFEWHHTPADMLDKVDALELRKHVAAMAVMAFVLADMPARLDDP